MDLFTLKPQLQPDTLLVGKKAKYRINKYISGGQAGETYLAATVDCGNPSRELHDGISVIVKYPRIHGSLTASEITERLARLNYLFTIEEATLGRLAGAQCVAQLLDSGNHSYIHRGQQVCPIFLVQQFIDGYPLSRWASSLKNSDEFSGIPDPAIFFTMARNLALALRDIHRRLVIHGDIWPENILVTSDGVPILIDFGQALFREAVTDPSQIPGRNTRYQAPESVRSVGGDIYSAGGVLFFLATGKDPIASSRDNDGLKAEISRCLQQCNPDLYTANCGVVDIIARCLRYGNIGRTRNAQSLLEDLDAFTEPPTARGLLEDASGLADAAGRLDASSRPLFKWMAGFQLREVSALLADLTQGVYDLAGEHDELVAALTQYVNFLEPGDEYLTVTVPQFWWPQNVGINGRFVAITKVAALRGAIIRRIFAVNEDDLATDMWFPKILEAQMKAVNEVSTYQTSGRYEAHILAVDIETRRRMTSDGSHFGLLLKGDDAVAIYPRYREDGLLVGIQFRSGRAMAQTLREEFELFEGRAVILREYYDAWVQKYHEQQI